MRQPLQQDRWFVQELGRLVTEAGTDVVAANVIRQLQDEETDWNNCERALQHLSSYFRQTGNQAASLYANNLALYCLYI